MWLDEFGHLNHFIVAIVIVQNSWGIIFNSRIQNGFFSWKKKDSQFPAIRLFRISLRANWQHNGMYFTMHCFNFTPSWPVLKLLPMMMSSRNSEAPLGIFSRHRVYFSGSFIWASWVFSATKFASASFTKIVFLNLFSLIFSYTTLPRFLDTFFLNCFFSPSHFSASNILYACQRAVALQMTIVV